MFIILLLILLIPVVYLVYHYYVHYGPNGRLIHKIPGPPGHPIIGNVLLGLGRSSETAMGTSLQEIRSFQQQYQKAVHQIDELFVYRLLRPWLMNDWIFSLTPKGRQQIKILKILHGFTEKIIEERKDYHKRTNGQYLKNLIEDTVADDVEIIGIRKKRLAMLDLLIQASQESLLTDIDIREEVDTFTFEDWEDSMYAANAVVTNQESGASRSPASSGMPQTNLH